MTTGNFGIRHIVCVNCGKVLVLPRKMNQHDNAEEMHDFFLSQGWEPSRDVIGSYVCTECQICKERNK